MQLIYPTRKPAPATWRANHKLARLHATTQRYGHVSDVKPKAKGTMVKPMIGN
jgi:hypothetical protein